MSLRTSAYDFLVHLYFILILFTDLLLRKLRQVGSSDVCIIIALYTKLTAACDMFYISVDLEYIQNLKQFANQDQGRQEDLSK